MPRPDNGLREGGRTRRRVVRVRFTFSAYDEIVISFRRFRTAKHRRSRNFSQTVYKTNIFSVREVAFALKPRPRHRRAVRQRLSFRRLTDQAKAGLALIAIGAVGSLYFGTHLQMAPQLYLSGPAKGPPFSRNWAFVGSALRGSKLDLIRPVAVKKPPPPPQLPPAMARSLPLRINIPAIQVDTSILPVGLNPARAIAMPDVFDQAGWYDQGPTPGERGPAVIVGHVDSPHNIAIFWRLRELQPGQLVSISRQDGTTATFKITDIEQFPQDRFPTQAVYGAVSYAGLRLITCGGTFNTLTGHYDMNTVVYGVLI